MEDKIIFNELTLDLAQMACFIEGVEVILTKHEYLLLKFLMENKNQIFSRQELLNEVWKTKVSLRTVDTTVSRLRKKLKQYSKYIKSKFGFGYGFITN